MTPDQKQTVRKRSRVDTQLYIDILTWFVKESGYPGYLNTSIPEDCSQPFLVEGISTRNNTDDSADESMEANYEGGTYYFSTAQDPSQHTSNSTHLYMVLLINLTLLWFSVLCQPYWHMVVHMLKMQ
jgi:hypothetical protein